MQLGTENMPLKCFDARRKPIDPSSVFRMHAELPTPARDANVPVGRALKASWLYRGAMTAATRNVGSMGNIISYAFIGGRRNFFDALTLKAAETDFSYLARTFDISHDLRYIIQVERSNISVRRVEDGVLVHQRAINGSFNDYAYSRPDWLNHPTTRYVMLGSESDVFIAFPSHRLATSEGKQGSSKFYKKGTPILLASLATERPSEESSLWVRSPMDGFVVSANASVTLYWCQEEDFLVFRFAFAPVERSGEPNRVLTQQFVAFGVASRSRRVSAMQMKLVPFNETRVPLTPVRSVRGTDNAERILAHLEAASQGGAAAQRIRESNIKRGIKMIEYFKGLPKVSDLFPASAFAVSDSIVESTGSNLNGAFVYRSTREGEPLGACLSDRWEFVAHSPGGNYALFTRSFEGDGGRYFLWARS